MEFRDSEFSMNKAFTGFKQELTKLLNREFTNGDAIRSLDDDGQLALILWNMPKFKSIEELHEWLKRKH